MSDLINYDFKSLTETIVKPLKYFMNYYVDKCLEFESLMRRTLDAK